MMGVIFAIMFFLFLLIAGSAATIVGIAGLLINGKRKKTGAPLPKGFTADFAALLSVGIAVTLIPVGFFGFIVMINVMPPKGFVNTDIVIEENGYQYTRFTADGVVYEVLDLQVYDTDAISNPVFAYKTAGFLNGAQCGNYYAIENKPDFHLVSDEYGLLFCPADERDAVITYYTDDANLTGYYTNRSDRGCKLSDHENKAVIDFRNINLASLHREKMTISDDAELFEIRMICKEGLVCADRYVFLLMNNKMYYMYDTEVAADGSFAYILIELPAEIADGLLAIHRK